MKKYQNLQGDEWRDKAETGGLFEWQFYQEFAFRTCQFTECRWVHAKFFRTKFIDCQFIGCSFEKCKFFGQHTYLGPAKFDGCTFLKCQIKDVQPWKATFMNTTFRLSHFDNISFYGQPSEWRTEFESVELATSQFTMTGFSGINLTTVKLPVTGMRVFQNANNQFKQALFDASGADASINDFVLRSKKCHRRGLMNLGDVRDGSIVADPVGHSEDFLASMLVDPAERTIFEAIASEYEITKRYI